MKIANRTFLVSGGSSGLGLATVHDLIRGGAYVSMLDRVPPPDLLLGAQFQFHKTDITKLPSIEAAVKQTVAWTEKTGAHLGGVINCAGVGLPEALLSYKNDPHSAALWDFTLAVNLTGTFNLTKLALPYLVKVPGEKDANGEDSEDAERGVIILVSSAAAHEGQTGQTAYSATKGALRSMALPMARDLARHAIRVVTIAPGAFRSAMTDPMSEHARAALIRDGIVYPKRFGHPDEFARTVRWVLECAYVNGETIRLSGAGRLPARM